jgi:hypothetical protein
MWQYKNRLQRKYGLFNRVTFGLPHTGAKNLFTSVVVYTGRSRVNQLVPVTSVPLYSGRLFDPNERCACLYEQVACPPAGLCDQYAGLYEHIVWS